MKKQFILLLASLLGALLSIYAMILTWEAHTSKEVVQSFCSINTLFDCKGVAASEAAMVFGMPVALWGLLYYLWISAMVLWTFFSSTDQKPMLRAALILSALAFAFSLYKAYQMLAELQVVCLVCTALYVLNAAIVWLLVRITDLKHCYVFGMPASLSQRTESATRHRAVKAYLHALFSFLAVYLVGYFVMKGSVPVAVADEAQRAEVPADSLSIKNMVAEEVALHFAQPKREIKVASGTPTQGNPQAPITIVAFSDFQCPYCSLAAARLKELLTAFNDQVKLHFMHYPLDQSINSAMTTNLHPFAGLAARAAVYAAAQGQFWPFHDDLFAIQEHLNKETILDLARKYGWDLNQFKHTIESEAVKDQVKAHIQSARDADVQGTPAVYINGRFVTQWQDPAVLRQILHRELQEIKMKNKS